MKKIIFSFILFVICYLSLEAFSFLAYKVKFGPYNHVQIQTSKLNAVRSYESGGVFTQDKDKFKERSKQREVLHPYFGYAIEGLSRKSNCEELVDENCYQRIKNHLDRPLFKKNDEEVIVGIFGGSVADGVARLASRTLIQELSNSPQHRGRVVSIYNLAGGGYKQPQQLGKLAYYYSMGAEFDVIINLDGFNEMAASYLNYRDQGVHPSYPVHWNSRVSSTVSENYLDLYAGKKLILKRHSTLAKVCLLKGVRYSPFMNFVFQIFDNRQIRNIEKIDNELNTTSKGNAQESSYQSFGPDYDFNDWNRFHDDVAAIWANSSLAMHALAVGRGARYYHFLQPNQYIEGSKLLSTLEKEKFVLKKGSYGNVYKAAHNNITSSGDSLRETGVNYTDLTYLFKDTSRTLYIDNCCHLNQDGYSVIAKKISDIISADHSLNAGQDSVDVGLLELPRAASE